MRANYEFLEGLLPYQTEILQSLPAGSEYGLSYKGDGYNYGISRSATEFQSEDEQRTWISETMNECVNVFRPWAEKVLRDEEERKANS